MQRFQSLKIQIIKEVIIDVPVVYLENPITPTGDPSKYEIS